MKHTIFCSKLKKQAEGLNSPPLPGEMGNKIYNEICKEAWDLWVNHQTILINEYRLSLIDPKARVFLAEEMEKFLFGAGSDKPKEFKEKS